MKIAVGSTNPVKVAAVRSVVERVWPEAKVIALAVPSGVAAMPMNDADCLTGARNRARAVQSAAGATLGIGLEGGVNQEPAGLMLLGWVALMLSKTITRITFIHFLHFSISSNFCQN